MGQVKEAFCAEIENVATKKYTGCSSNEEGACITGQMAVIKKRTILA